MRLARINRTDHINIEQEDKATGTHTHSIAEENVKWCHHIRKLLCSFSVKYTLATRPSHSTSRYLLKFMKTYVRLKKLYTNVHSSFIYNGPRL